MQADSPLSLWERVRVRVNRQSTHPLELQEGISEITESHESQFRRMPAALSDLRVLDLSNDIAGAFCSKLFADFGADVIKVRAALR